MGDITTRQFRDGLGMIVPIGLSLRKVTAKAYTGTAADFVAGITDDKITGDNLGILVQCTTDAYIKFNGTTAATTDLKVLADERVILPVGKVTSLSVVQVSTAGTCKVWEILGV